MDDGHILVIEDDADIREGIRILLEGEGYRIEEAGNGNEGIALLKDDMDLVILDVMMPGISGFKTCEEIRKISNVPVLFLTAKAQESDKVMGLMAGGDDYLAKPFSYTELLIRVKALLRRYWTYQGKMSEAQTEETWLVRSDIKINTQSNIVFVRGTKVTITDLGYKILLLLMQNPDKIFSAQTLYETIWKKSYCFEANGDVMMQIQKLRVKIEEDAQDPKRICTVWGKGYRFE